MFKLWNGAKTFNIKCPVKKEFDVLSYSHQSHNTRDRLNVNHLMLYINTIYYIIFTFINTTLTNMDNVAPRIKQIKKNLILVPQLSVLASLIYRRQERVLQISECAKSFQLKKIK